MIARAAGIIASSANIFSTPRKNSEAVIVGEMTVATDCAEVVRPSAVPVLGKPQLSDMSACMIGKIAALKKPIDNAPNMSRGKFGDPKNRAYERSTATEIAMSNLFLLS